MIHKLLFISSFSIDNGNISCRIQVCNCVLATSLNMRLSSASSPFSNCVCKYEIWILGASFQHTK